MFEIIVQIDVEDIKEIKDLDAEVVPAELLAQTGDAQTEKTMSKKKEKTKKKGAEAAQAKTMGGKDHQEKSGEKGFRLQISYNDA